MIYLMQQTVLMGWIMNLQLPCLPKCTSSSPGSKNKPLRDEKAAEAAGEQLKMQQTWKQLRAKTPCKYLSWSLRGGFVNFRMMLVVLYAAILSMATASRVRSALCHTTRRIFHVIIFTKRNDAATEIRADFLTMQSMTRNLSANCKRA